MQSELAVLQAKVAYISLADDILKDAAKRSYPRRYKETTFFILDAMRDTYLEQRFEVECQWDVLMLG